MEDSENEVKMTAAEFWTRFAVWIGLAVVAPLVYICVRFDVFSPSSSSTSFSGVSIIGIIIVAICMLFIINEARKALPRSSFPRQIVDGIMALLPLVALILIIHSAKKYMDALEEMLIFITIFEALAIPANPMRKWSAQQVEDKQESKAKKLIANLVDKLNGSKEK